MKKAVFLDRDGVINRVFIRNGRPCSPDTLEEFEILPNVPEALRLLHQAEFLLIIVTNQPDVGKGLVPQKVVESMHDQMRRSLILDDIEVCYSTDEDRSFRRKPQPGMLLDAAKKWTIDLSQSFMVGDRWRDIEAGQAAGCRTILIDYGYEENHPVTPDYVVHSTLEAAQIILKSADSDKLKKCS